MSWDEHIMLIAHTSKIYGNELSVIGNTGSNSTREAVHATEQGFAVGMDAALQINPYYGKTSRAGLMKHFYAVLDFGPTIVYNVPARTTQDITAEVIFELAKHKNFLGVKECEGNERIRNYTKNGITCWSGNDDEAHDAKWECGAAGVISVTSNVVPTLMRDMLLQQKPNPKLRDDLIPLMRWLFKEPNPIGVNTALALLGSSEPVFRLPYVPYDSETRAEGSKLLQQIGLDKCSGAGKIKKLSDDDFILLDQW
jgi:4-hydroxy-tetrahydrodipicolinate synthase